MVGAALHAVTAAVRVLRCIKVSDTSAQRVTGICELLHDAARKTRVLSHLGWHSSVRESFFKAGAKELPVVEYPDYNAEPVLEKIAHARSQLQGAPIDQWLNRQADAIENSARMLVNTGTPAFFDYSRRLYGAPDDPLIDGKSTCLTLAQTFDQTLDSLKGFDQTFLPERAVSSEEMADNIKTAVVELFADDAPDVFLVDELSANALAGSERIRIRRAATFNDKDIPQLIHHEAGIHVATSLNGKHQHRLPILGASHAGTTRTQEGLAVFSEFITGSMDLARLRRLADRTIAIKMAADGADFLQVYEYFLERTGAEIQAFENTRRVFRGGLLTGSAPFTKDIVYLDGLIRVHNFLRTLVSQGRPDCLHLLFCGKLDLEDIPVLAELSQAGLCHRPKFLPDWARDMRFLLSYLAYSAFLNTINLQTVGSHYEELLRNAPLVELDS